jgi:glycosyltransferase involved in cell wall biosynthesis
MSGGSRLPIRVLLGITELNVGGAEKSLVELALRLDPKRFAVHVVSLQERGPLGERLRLEGVPVTALGMRSMGDLWRGRRSLVDLVRRERSAIFVTFLFHANMLGRWCSRRVGIPHVSGVRVAEEGKKWHLWLDRWTARAGDRYVAVSEHAAGMTRQNVPGAEVVCIPNGVDIDRLSTGEVMDGEPFGIGADQHVLLWMGRMVEQKDVMSAVEGIVPLAEGFRRANAVAVFVGDGPDRVRAAKIADEAGLADVVRWVGWSEKPLEWHRRSQGLLISSRWEGMPNVVLEAMGVGNPVIARDFPGARELVVDGETGWIAQGGMTGAIRDWLADPVASKERGARGMARVRDQFTLDRTIGRWEEYLERLVESS